MSTATHMVGLAVEDNWVVEIKTGCELRGFKPYA